MINNYVNVGPECFQLPIAECFKYSRNALNWITVYIVFRTYVTYIAVAFLKGFELITPALDGAFNKTVAPLCGPWSST